MSEILAHAISDFLERLPTERHFDLPLMALLRIQGFFDIHFIHGPLEFGKDFVAKRADDGQTFQYAFQSKRGNLTTAAHWNQVEPQCEQMATLTLSHPSFSSELPRKTVLILTGRLQHHASIACQDYKSNLSRRGLPILDVWDREQLVEQLTAPACLGRSFDWREFGHFLWEAVHRDTIPSVVEPYTRRWLRQLSAPSLWTSCLEYALVRDELDKHGLGFHAFRLLLGLERAVAVAEDSGTIDAPTLAQVEALIKGEIAIRAQPILDWYDALTGDDHTHFLIARELSDLAQVSARAFLILEIVALYEMSHPSLPPEEYSVIRRLLVHILSLGAARRPLSDDYAAGTLAIAVLAARMGVMADDWIVAISDWIHESYDGEAPGLAPARQSATEELWRSMAQMVEHSGTRPRRESVLAPAILDACSALGRADAYDRAVAIIMRNEHLIPVRTIPKHERGQFQLESGAWAHVMGGWYPPRWVGVEGWQNGQPHRFADRARDFDKRGAHWVGVAMSLLLRDRWWLHSFRKLVPLGSFSDRE